MEPIKTHGAALPLQELTRPAGGCPSGSRPEDLVLEGQEGANLLVGRRVANADTLQPPGVSSLVLGDVERKSATRLDIYKLLVAAAKTYGKKTRPADLDITDRIGIIFNFLYPSGVPNGICLSNTSLKENVIKFTHKCEKFYSLCSRNMPYFCKKYHAWLSRPFKTEFSDQLVEIPPQNEITMQQVIANNNPKEVHMELDQETDQTTIETCTGADKKVPSTVIDSSLSAPSTSNSQQGESERQQHRSLKNLEQSLEDQPRSKIIKLFSKTVTDDDGAKLSTSITHEFEFVAKECLKSPTRAKKIAHLIRNESETKPLSPDDALFMIIERKLTVDDYTSMQQDLKHRGFKAYPPYYKVQAAKKLCYPEEDVIVEEKEATISLFSLLLHTFRRIVESNDKIITAYCEQTKQEIIQCTLEGSWGFDGTTGQSAYKQKFTDNDDDEHCLFTTTFIPLILKTLDGFVLWKNPNPQSYRYCRPIKIQYHQENKSLVLNEKKRMGQEMTGLTSLYAETSSGQSVIADTKLYLTIIDGKVYNIITDTSSQLRCACCGATASEFNKLDVINKKSVNLNALLHGLSPLHAWIRLFEFLLHLGYKNDPAINTWRVSKNSAAARIMEERKKKIQSEIRSKMSLLIDVVRPNSGTSNDGNTARTAFSDENRHMFASILGVDEWLVDDFHTILVALSSGLPIDPEKFRVFSTSVADKYVGKYGWFYMSVTMHKILIHGWQIIEKSPLPIGMVSEQAGESRNKFWRYDREHHTRKINRKSTILDLFHRALESSDPFISDLSLKGRMDKRKRIPIPPKVLSLLKPTEPVTTMLVTEDAEYTSLLNDEKLIYSDEE